MIPGTAVRSTSKYFAPGDKYAAYERTPYDIPLVSSCRTKLLPACPRASNTCHTSRGAPVSGKGISSPREKHHTAVSHILTPGSTSYHTAAGCILVVLVLVQEVLEYFVLLCTSDGSPEECGSIPVQYTYRRGKQTATQNEYTK